MSKPTTAEQRKLIAQAKREARRQRASSRKHDAHALSHWGTANLFEIQAKLFPAE